MYKATLPLSVTSPSGRVVRFAYIILDILRVLCNKSFHCIVIAKNSFIRFPLFSLNRQIDGKVGNIITQSKQAVLLPISLPDKQS